MTRIMYDAITPANIPANAQMVAGYVNGRWPSYAEAKASFPHAVAVSIAVNIHADAQVLDVEKFDATPAESVGWCIRQRSLGRVPTVYMAAGDAWTQVRQAFQARGVAEPLYWVANWSDGPEIPPGAIAVQYANNEAAGYDVSLVSDYWPGVDKAQAPLIPSSNSADLLTTLKKGVPDVFRIQSKQSGKIECHYGNGYFMALSGPLDAIYNQAGIPCFVFATDEEQDNFRNHIQDAYGRPRT